MEKLYIKCEVDEKRYYSDIEELEKGDLFEGW